MDKTDKLNHRKYMYLMNMMASKDAEHAEEIAEKDEEIDHYRRQYELAVERRKKERHDRGERRKDMIALAVFAVLTCRVAVPGLLFALEEFWRWANGM